MKTLIVSLLAASTCLLLVAQNPIFFGQNQNVGLPRDGLILWYSADCITYSGGACTVPSNGTHITTWSDQSGSGTSGTVTTGTCTYNTGQINSKPAVNFSSCALSIGSGFGIGPGGCETDSSHPCLESVFAVWHQTATGSKGSFTSCGSTNTGCFKYWTGTTKEQGVDLSDLAQVATGTASQDTSWHQMNVQASYYKNPTTINWFGAFRKDRASDGTFSSVAAAHITSLTQTVGEDTLSSTEFLNGDLAFLAVYVGVPTTAAKQAQIENYLYNQYGR